MHLDFPLWFEATSLTVIVLILAADLIFAYRRPHVPKPLESGIWVGAYVVLALIFAFCVAVVGGHESATQFLAGWLTEYSLSVDNLFVFVIIMARFALPAKYHQEALMVGILVALVLRGIFIVVGAGLIAALGWVFYLFGAYLVYTAVKQALEKESGDSAEAKDGRFMAMVRRHLGISEEFDGGRVRTTVDGKRMFTPMILVFVSLGSTDLLFALDSIPAIFGITTSPFLVFTSNLFALMGLRQLYFLLGHLLDRLVYLRFGVAVVLAFIGVKLVLHALHDNELPFIAGGHGVSWAPDLSTGVSIAVIFAAVVLSVVASLIWGGQTKAASANRGNGNLTS